MAIVTVQTGEIEPYDGSETAPLLRIFCTQLFVASNGDIIPKGLLENDDFYKEIACSVAANVITYPQFTIHSTADALSDEEGAGYTFALFTAAGVLLKVLHKGMTVPVTTPTTLGGIVTSNDEEEEAPAASPTAITNGGGNAKITTSASAPSSPTVGDWWLDTN